MAQTAKSVGTRRIPEPAVELLKEAGDVWVSPDDRPLETAELHDAVKGADIAVTLLHDKVDDAFLDAAGDQLRAVCNVAVGFDNIDVPAATKRGVLVTNTPGVLTEATADLAMTLILAVTRRIGEGERLLRRREEWSWHMFMLLGMGLQEKTLGVLGMGAIGQSVARRGGPAGTARRGGGGAFGKECLPPRRAAGGRGGRAGARPPPRRARRAAAHL